MQILESTMFALRSARVNFRQRDTAIEVTLFPMVHVGDQAFYDEVHADALDHDVILFEGVRSKQTSSLTASYRWLDLARLGLVVQPKLDENAADQAGTRLVHADISTEEAHELWRRMPLWLRTLLAVGAPAYGAYRRFFATRQSIAKGMSKDMLRSRRAILEDGDELQPMRDMVEVARDKRLIEVLDQELTAAANDTRFAIIYGASHMPPVISHLHSLDFVLQPAKWMTIFKLD